MRQDPSDRANVYQIVIKETLDHDLIDRYGDFTVIPHKHGETILVGKFTDQPALRGFLDQLWNLNITVITVERLENES